MIATWINQVKVSKMDWLKLSAILFGEFLSHYCIANKSGENSVGDCQPVLIKYDVIKESNHMESYFLVPMMTSNEKLKCWKVKAV